jgi:hypothetical protein
MFRTNAVKIIKPFIMPIDGHHPRSSSLPHVDTGPTVSSSFGTLRGIRFLSDCQALSAIQPGSPQWCQTGVLSASISFLEIEGSHRVFARFHSVAANVAVEPGINSCVFGPVLRATTTAV